VIRAAVLALLLAQSDPPAVVEPPAPLPARYVRTLAHQPDGYDPQRGPAATDLLLGDLLFHSPHVLGARAQALGLSCQACHPNGATNRAFFLPGQSDRPGNVDLSTARFNPGAENHVPDFINIPSLRGARFTAPYGHDGRHASLAEFVGEVVSGEFGAPALPPRQLAALVRYVQELDFVPNRILDERGRLTGTASARARRGEALFAVPRRGFGGASCATCHVPSTFFRDGKVHRFGPAAAGPHALDNGFETPTLLGAAESAPYFHDGRADTLAAAVAWLDQAFELRLTARDAGDLTAYLEAVGAVDRPRDERPLARQLADTFAYLRLLVDGQAREDRTIWVAALDLALREVGRSPQPPALAPAIADARASLGALRDQVRGGAPLGPLRPRAEALSRSLLRLAADWAGALAEGAN
jgi:mono/diheme cytochrome c family protein